MPFSFRSIRRSQSIELLASLVLLICIAAFIDPRTTHGAIVSLLFAFVLIAAVRSVTTDKRFHVVAYGLVVLELLTEFLRIATQNELLQLVSDPLSIAFCFFCAGMMLRKIVTAKKVDFEVLCTSISVYLLVAIAWALSYDLINTLWPDSFSAGKNGADLTLTHFMYFSLTTITTLGYGDITPASVPAGIWSTLEAATGLFYMAILVARLVSMYRT